VLEGCAEAVPRKVMLIFDITLLSNTVGLCRYNTMCILSDKRNDTATQSGRKEDCICKRMYLSDKRTTLVAESVTISTTVPKGKDRTTNLSLIERETNFTSKKDGDYVPARLSAVENQLR
jgi:hypothetical protein